MTRYRQWKNEIDHVVWPVGVVIGVDHHFEAGHVHDGYIVIGGIRVEFQHSYHSDQGFSCFVVTITVVNGVE
jgi:hypothetical protein